MKWLIASDIHGSAYYCRRLLEALEAEGADRLLLLGDVLYHGPRNDLPRDYAPKEVTAMLQGRKGRIFAVRGNCDAEIDEVVLGFPLRADYLLMNVGTHLLFVTHGHLYDEEHLPPLSPGDILLHGHTHVPHCTPVGDIVSLNPGSVSLPKEASWHGYMTLKNTLFLWKDLDGVERLRYEAEP